MLVLQIDFDRIPGSRDVQFTVIASRNSIPTSSALRKQKEQATKITVEEENRTAQHDGVPRAAATAIPSADEHADSAV